MLLDPTHMPCAACEKIDQAIDMVSRQTLKRTSEVAAFQEPGDRTEIRSGISVSRMFALFAFVLGVAVSACAPIPCAPGYGDPNWCHRNIVGFGG
jgi:hypothetical protein